MTEARRPLAAWLALMRPHHWVKNVFVVLPIPFAIAAGSEFDVVRVVAGFFGFSLLASAVYALNDTWDADKDRRHPTKRNRPVAAGALSVRTAVITGLGLILAGVGLSYVAGATDRMRQILVALAVGYLAIQVVYTTVGRSLAGVDVMLLSSGFVVRVGYGCALVQARPSGWLLLCTTAIALFLALTKRRADLVTGVDPEHRPSLAGYSTRGVDVVLTITAVVACIAYGLYCHASPVFRPGWQFASLPFVVVGFLNDLRLIRRVPGESPVERLYRHPSHAINLLLWGAVIALSLERS
ncbi:MAG: UbiA prenyltransferase family protein [Planctomycetota bacterium]